MFSVTLRTWSAHDLPDSFNAGQPNSIFYYRNRSGQFLHIIKNHFSSSENDSKKTQAHKNRENALNSSARTRSHTFVLLTFSVFPAILIYGIYNMGNISTLKASENTGPALTCEAIFSFPSVQRSNSCNIASTSYQAWKRVNFVHLYHSFITIGSFSEPTVSFSASFFFWKAFNTSDSGKR